MELIIWEIVKKKKKKRRKNSAQIAWATVSIMEKRRPCYTESWLHYGLCNDAELFNSDDTGLTVADR